jgi:rhodanese-related sulfurtransferase
MHCPPKESRMSLPRLLRHAWLGAVLVLGAQAALAQAALAETPAATASRVVPTIDTPELVALLAGRDKPGATSDFVLVDVRSARETTVSVIPGAILLAEFERDAARHRGKLVIPYCTVGGRSGAYARKLAGAGWQVRNYAGSILAWAGAGQPLVTPAGEPTRWLHAFNSRFDAPAGYSGWPMRKRRQAARAAAASAVSATAAACATRSTAASPRPSARQKRRAPACSCSGSRVLACQSIARSIMLCAAKATAARSADPA